MKYLLFFILSPLLLFAEANMVEQINKTLNQIAYEAEHSPKIKLDIQYDPFYHDKRLKKRISQIKTKKILQKKKKKGLVLSMILNKKAFINGIWYREKAKVAQYMLDKVNQDSVVLKRKNKIIVLKLQTSDNLLVKKEVL
jgi:hypothetical protein